MTETITIALSKGRIFKETMPLLKAAGIEALDDPETSRKLILDTTSEHIKLVIIRATSIWRFRGRATPAALVRISR